MTRSDWELHRSRVTGALVDSCDCENVETRTSVARGEQRRDSSTGSVSSCLAPSSCLSTSLVTSYTNVSPQTSVTKISCHPFPA